jgi:hypothetical protein
MRKIIVLTMFLFSSLVFGFECTNPGRDVEKFICENPTLSSLNETHNQYSKKVGDVKPGETREINQDLYFDLNKCDNDIQCISSSYSKSTNSFIKLIEENKSQFITTEDKPNPKEIKNTITTKDINYDENKIYYVISSLLLVLISLLNPVIFYINKFRTTSKDGFQKVGDGFNLIYFLVSTVVLLFISLLVMTKVEVGIVGMSLIIGIYILLNYFWYENQLGYVINTNLQTLTFSTVTLRKTIPISSIKSVDKKEEFHQKTNKNGEIETFYLYFINLVTDSNDVYTFQLDLTDRERLYSLLTS